MFTVFLIPRFSIILGCVSSKSMSKADADREDMGVAGPTESEAS